MGLVGFSGGSWGSLGLLWGSFWLFVWLCGTLREFQELYGLDLGLQGWI